jgi:hypothetical protein
MLFEVKRLNESFSIVSLEIKGFTITSKFSCLGLFNWNEEGFDLNLKQEGLLLDKESKYSSFKGFEFIEKPSS